MRRRAGWRVVAAAVAAFAAPAATQLCGQLAPAPEICQNTSNACAFVVPHAEPLPSCDDACAGYNLTCVGAVRHDAVNVCDMYRLDQADRLPCTAASTSNKVCICDGDVPGSVAVGPTAAPSAAPTALPTTVPTESGMGASMGRGMSSDTESPTQVPTRHPTSWPSRQPTNRPTTRPPSRAPSTRSPTRRPTRLPTQYPTEMSSPTQAPTPTCPGLGPDPANCTQFTDLQQLCPGLIELVCPATCNACTRHPTALPTRAPVALPTRAPSAPPPTVDPDLALCEAESLCVTCGCSAGPVALVQCVEAGSVALPTTNVSSLLPDAVEVGLSLRNTEIEGRMLTSRMLRPWAEAYRFTSFELDSTLLFRIEFGAFDVAVDLVSLTIKNEPILHLRTELLGLPSSLTTLVIDTVPVASIDFRRNPPNEEEALRVRSRRQTVDPPLNLTSLVLSHVGLDGLLAVATWFDDGSCTLHSLEVVGNNLTSVDVSGCPDVLSIDLSGNTGLNCSASQFGSAVDPQVRGSALCAFPGTDCSFGAADVAAAAQIWQGPTGADPAVFVTAGQQVAASPTWAAFARDVLSQIAVGANGSVVAAAEINSRCPAVKVMYAVQAFAADPTGAVAPSVGVPNVDGVELRMGSIDAVGAPRFRPDLAVGNATAYAVAVAFDNNGTVHPVGTFTLTVAPLLQSRSRAGSIAYVGSQADIAPVVQCVGGRDTAYHVRNGTSIPPGMVLDSHSGFLRGTVDPTLSDPALAPLLSGAAETIEWPVHLVCVDANEQTRELPPSDLVIKPPFGFQCPTDPTSLPRVGGNVVPATRVFNQTPGVWYTAVDVAGLALPDGLRLSGPTGEVFGTTCMPADFQFLVRVSFEDATTTCVVRARIHENSGASGCPADAEYMDTTGNAYDGQFRCRCPGGANPVTWDVVPAQCGQPSRSCPAADADDSHAGRRERTIILTVLLSAVALLGALVGWLWWRRRRALAAAAAAKSEAQGWSCASPAAHLEMSPGALVYKAKLGSGHFGVVSVVEVQASPKRRPSNNKPAPPTSGRYACKRCVRDDVTNKDREEFVAEIAISVDMTHKNILRTCGIITQAGPDNLCMLTELCPAGDLHHFLRARQPNALGKGVSQVGMLKFCVGAAEGLEYLASKGFVHRDIACRNCLLTADFVVKIGDFGLSRRVGVRNYYRKTTEGLLPVRWMSPESLSQSIYTAQSDLWSLGVLFWEIFTYGDVPYSSMSHRAVVEEVAAGYRLPRPVLMKGVRPFEGGHELYTVCLSLWEAIPADRPPHNNVVEYLNAAIEQSRAAGMTNSHNRQYSLLRDSSVYDEDNAETALDLTPDSNDPIPYDNLEDVGGGASHGGPPDRVQEFELATMDINGRPLEVRHVRESIESITSDATFISMEDPARRDSGSIGVVERRGSTYVGPLVVKTARESVTSIESETDFESFHSSRARHMLARVASAELGDVDWDPDVTAPLPHLEGTPVRRISGTGTSHVSQSTADNLLTDESDRSATSTLSGDWHHNLRESVDSASPASSAGKRKTLDPPKVRRGSTPAVSGRPKSAPGQKVGSMKRGRRPSGIPLAGSPPRYKVTDTTGSGGHPVLYTIRSPIGDASDSTDSDSPKANRRTLYVPLETSDGDDTSMVLSKGTPGSPMSVSPNSDYDRVLNHNGPKSGSLKSVRSNRSNSSTLSRGSPLASVSDDYDTVVAKVKGPPAASVKSKAPSSTAKSKVSSDYDRMLPIKVKRKTEPAPYDRMREAVVAPPRSDSAGAYDKMNSPKRPLQGGSSSDYDRMRDPASRATDSRSSTKSSTNSSAKSSGAAGPTQRRTKRATSSRATGATNAARRGSQGNGHESDPEVGTRVERLSRRRPQSTSPTLRKDEPLYTSDKTASRVMQIADATHTDDYDRMRSPTASDNGEDDDGFFGNTLHRRSSAGGVRIASAAGTPHRTFDSYV
eukprot:m.95761 g.95761  ORF g.95761 m.95761 type:complete len:1942 (+) comp12340_c0_seq1:238-6063(+)